MCMENAVRGSFNIIRDRRARLIESESSDSGTGSVVGRACTGRRRSRPRCIGSEWNGTWNGKCVSMWWRGQFASIKRNWGSLGAASVHVLARCTGNTPPAILFSSTEVFNLGIRRTVLDQSTNLLSTVCCSPSNETLLRVIAAFDIWNQLWAWGEFRETIYSLVYPLLIAKCD